RAWCCETYTNCGTRRRRENQIVNFAGPGENWRRLRHSPHQVCEDPVIQLAGSLARNIDKAHARLPRRIRPAHHSLHVEACTRVEQVKTHPHRLPRTQRTDRLDSGPALAEIA